MPDAGDTVIEKLTVSPFDGTTAAALTVTLPDGTVNPPGNATTADNGNNWSKSTTYPTAGEYILKWVVTGTGAGTEYKRVQVGPAPVTTGKSYASTTDLANWLEAAPPAGAWRLLRRATELIDEMLLTAVYDVDDDGLPTEATVIAALRDATCELVSWWEQTGDEHGAVGEYASVTIGGVSLARGSGGHGGHSTNARRVGPQVIAILNNAGLLSQSPQGVW